MSCAGHCFSIEADRAKQLPKVRGSASTNQPINVRFPIDLIRTRNKQRSGAERRRFPEFEYPLEFWHGKRITKFQQVLRHLPFVFWQRNFKQARLLELLVPSWRCCHTSRYHPPVLSRHCAGQKSNPRGGVAGPDRANHRGSFWKRFLTSRAFSLGRV